jgi:hypothetical protein
MSQVHRPSSARQTLREGAEEVREKLKADLSHFARARRAVSLKPTVGCLSCDATGKVACGTCGGSGHARFVMGEEPEKCHTCLGSGHVTCVECAGRGWVLNKHRKKIIWLLAVGAAAWALVLYRLWGGDIAPEMRANLFKTGGGSFSGKSGGGYMAPRTAQPGLPANPPGSVPR